MQQQVDELQATLTERDEQSDKRLRMLRQEHEKVKHALAQQTHEAQDEVAALRREVEAFKLAEGKGRGRLRGRVKELDKEVREGASPPPATTGLTRRAHQLSRVRTFYQDKVKTLKAQAARGGRGRTVDPPPIPVAPKARRRRRVRSADRSDTAARVEPPSRTLVSHSPWLVLHAPACTLALFHAPPPPHTHPQPPTLYTAVAAVFIPPSEARQRRRASAADDSAVSEALARQRAQHSIDIAEVTERLTAQLTALQ